MSLKIYQKSGSQKKITQDLAEIKQSKNKIYQKWSSQQKYHSRSIKNEEVKKTSLKIYQKWSSQQKYHSRSINNQAVNQKITEDPSKMKQSKNTTQDLSKIKHSTTISLKIYQKSSIQHKYDSRSIKKEEEVKPYHSRSSKNPAVKEIPLKCYHKSSSQTKASRSPKTSSHTYHSSSIKDQAVKTKSLTKIWQLKKIIWFKMCKNKYKKQIPADPRTNPSRSQK